MSFEDRFKTNSNDDRYPYKTDAKPESSENSKSETTPILSDQVSANEEPVKAENLSVGQDYETGSGNDHAAEAELPGQEMPPKQPAGDVKEMAGLDSNNDLRPQIPGSFQRPPYKTFDEMAKEHKKKAHRKNGLITLCIVAGMLLVFGGSMAGSAFYQYYKNDVADVQKPDNNGNNTETTNDNGNTPKVNIVSVKDEEEPATVDEQGRTILSIPQISEKVKPCVVGIVTENLTQLAQSGTGSGIIMTPDGYIITNYHVVENADKLTVVLDSGKSYTAKVIGSDEKTDLAVIKIDATNLTAAEFGNSDNLKVGDLAVAIGNPMGIELQGTVTSGIISAINRDITVEDRVMTLIQTDASINPGNSGGPLVNKYGQVIGINTVKLGISYYEGLGFAIPMNTAKPIIDELIKDGSIVGRPAIGISGRGISERAATYYSIPQGVLIDYVQPDSDAAKQGLQAGDIITSFDKTKITTMNEIQKLLDKYKAGQSVTIGVFRDGKTLDITFKLMDETKLNKE